ncbi:MAG: hypothetical protein QOH60_502 [Mycobacterium sp.]|nr:hypothetical protein [Mycobacterium sp.]
MRAFRVLRVTWRLIVLTAVLACASAVLVAGCSSTGPDVSNGPQMAPALNPIPVPMPTIAAPVWDARGELVTNEPLTNLDSSVRDLAGDARRATYRSTSGTTGAGTEVSGIFFIPKGDPPQDGWPVISVAHGVTGLMEDCGPSTHPDLLGLSTIVAGALSLRTAVAATDYEGLGTPGRHPFLEPRTAGFNVIDAVRALRNVFPGISTRWLAYGQSQGGQASWAANELSGPYGGGLDLLGAVALAPAANVSGLAENAFSGRLSALQVQLMPIVVTAIQRSFPGVPVDHLLHGIALQSADEMIGCGPAADEARAKLSPADVKPSTQADADSLADSLRKMALPQGPVSAPMIVVSGARDDVIPPAWISFAVGQSCRSGGTIEYSEQEGADHGQVGPDPRVLTWITDRLANKPATSNCTAR